MIARWLGFGKPVSHIGLRPHRDVEIATGYAAVYECVLDAVVSVLGANVTLADRSAGTINAAFGLVNNERIRCTLQPIDDTHTAARIEAFFPAGTEIPERSRAVDALADALAGSPSQRAL